MIPDDTCGIHVDFPFEVSSYSGQSVCENIFIILKKPWRFRQDRKTVPMLIGDYPKSIVFELINLELAYKEKKN